MNRRTAIGTIVGSGIVVLTGSTTERTDGGSSAASDDLTTESVTEPAETNERVEVNEPLEAGVAFDLELSTVTECGTTCRDVTATITNIGDTDATGVDVTVTVSTDGDDLWETTESIGTLEAGTSVTRTQHVQLGITDGLAIRNNGNRVTIATLVTSDQHVERIVREETM